MNFCSTRNQDASYGLTEALFSPRAADGGLFLPAAEYDLKPYLFRMDRETPFAEIVARIAPCILGEDASPALVDALVERASALNPAMREIDENISVLELFHGPCGVFQDFSMGFLADLMSALAPSRKGRAAESPIRILVATSGDTGKAAARAFDRRPGVELIIVHPRGSPIPVDPASLRSNGGNVSLVAMDGDYHSCQDACSALLSSRETAERFNLAAATTMNPGRLVTQVFHYFFAFTRIAEKASDFYFAVPSGNYGNFSSGLLAWRWGLPVTGFITATTTRTGLDEYRVPHGDNGLKKADGGRNAERLDPGFAGISNPENFERINALSAGNPFVLRSMIRDYFVTDKQVSLAKGDALSRHGVALDDYGAAGYSAAMRAREEILEESGQIVLIATSSPRPEATDAASRTGPSRSSCEDEVTLPSGASSLMTYLSGR